MANSRLPKVCFMHLPMTPYMQRRLEAEMKKHRLKTASEDVIECSCGVVRAGGSEGAENFNQHLIEVAFVFGILLQ